MAITRSQQAKQMLQDGGMLVKPGFGGMRQGYRGGQDASRGDFSSPSGNTGNTGGNTDRERGIMSRGKGPKGTTGNIGGFTDTGPDRSKVSQFSTFGKNVMARNLTPSFSDRLGNIIGMSPTIRGVKLVGGLLNKVFGPRGFNPNDLLGTSDYQGTTGPSSVDDDDNIGGGEGGGPLPYWAQLGYSSEAEYNAAMGGGVATSAPEPAVDLNRVAYRLMADGGAVMDDEPRQAYGLGSIVKKATRAVKKVVKSDIGKAAILGAIAFGIPGMGASGGLGGGLFGRASFGGAAPGVFGFGGIGNALAAGKAKFLGTKALPSFVTGPRELGMTTRGLGLGKKAALGIAGISALPLLGVGVEEEEEEEGLSPYLGEGLDIARIRSDPFGAMGQSYRLMAEGGDTEDAKEPVAKKVMPLLDMDGMEKDYRAEGGFVPIGRMEKADDVPARLSKNEFVFTADAVRNAGDGNVDKGAEVMYNMMKNLEAGGEVSEESQGLEGARRMFQTSKRLEEVL